MWATPTTTSRYALMEEQLLKETWTLYTWSFANSKCGGGMWVPRSKFFSQFISCLGIGVRPCSLLHKRKKWKKMRGVAIVTILSPSTRCRGKYSQCPAFDIKQIPAGRSPKDHQVHTHAYLFLNNAQSCFTLPLSILVCSSLNVWLQHTFIGVLNQAWCLG